MADSISLSLSEILAQAAEIKRTMNYLNTYVASSDRHKPYDEGHFDLFLAADRETAEGLVLSVDPLQSSYVSRKNEHGQTALHFHSLAGRSEVVQYLLELNQPGKHVMLSIKDQLGQTALHMADSKAVAEALLDALPSEDRQDYILIPNLFGRTAVHTAIDTCKHEVIQCLMSNIQHHGDPRLLTPGGQSPLHLAKDVETMKCFIDSLPPDKRKDFLCVTMGPPKYSVLQRAVIEGKVDVVRYLLSLPDLSELSILVQPNRMGETVWHLAKNKDVATELVTGTAHYGKGKQNDWLFIKNISQQTAFRDHAFEGRSDVLSLLLSQLTTEDCARLLTEKDNWGKTCLHWAKDQDCAQLLLEAVDETLRIPFIQVEDRKGNTCLASAAEQGKVDVFRYLFDVLEEEIDMDTILSHKNADDNDIYHLAYKSEESKQFYQLFEDIGAYCENDTLTTRDEKGNTPILYMASRFLPEAFAQSIMAFPLAQRKKLLLQKNRHGADCFTIVKSQRFDPEYYLKKVLGKTLARGNAPLLYHYQEQRLYDTGVCLDPTTLSVDDCVKTGKIMYYAINEYSSRANLICNSMLADVPSKLRMLKMDTRELHGTPKVRIK